MDDALDLVISGWHRQYPQLDPQPLAVVGRILRLAGILERRANQALQPFDLPVWAFDVLMTLRRQGRPFAMTPTELMNSTMLSSGAMTNRIDRLEKRKLVRRQPAPNDRRSMQVRLTPAGIKLVSRAAGVRLIEARQALRAMPRRDQKSLASLLRQLALSLE